MAASVETNDRILDAAALVFAEHGFSPASLRQITKKAGANLAAVNYHFGSKRDLYRQILLRRIRPLNEDRLARLMQAEQLAGEHPVPLRAILETLIRPLLRPAVSPGGGGFHTLRVVGRDSIESPPFIREELAREFEPLLSRYTKVIGQALPGIPPPVIRLRLHFILGALHAAIATREFSRRDVATPRDADDWEETLARLIEFSAAGIGAPASAPFD